MMPRWRRVRMMKYPSILLLLLVVLSFSQPTTLRAKRSVFFGS
jgi:hypothetical protein